MTHEELRRDAVEALQAAYEKVRLLKDSNARRGQALSLAIRIQDIKKHVEQLPLKQQGGSNG